MLDLGAGTVHASLELLLSGVQLPAKVSSRPVWAFSAVFVPFRNAVKHLGSRKSAWLMTVSADPVVCSYSKHNVASVERTGERGR